MKFKCNVDNCIYKASGKCISETVTLDEMGECYECAPAFTCSMCAKFHTVECRFNGMMDGTDAVCGKDFQLKDVVKK